MRGREEKFRPSLVEAKVDDRIWYAVALLSMWPAMSGEDGAPAVKSLRGFFAAP